METNLDFFHIIDIESWGTPPQQYGKPDICRHCGCKLNRYNPLDACYPCQEAGKEFFPRDIKITAEEEKKRIKNVLNVLRKNFI